MAQSRSATTAFAFGARLLATRTSLTPPSTAFASARAPRAATHQGLTPMAVHAQRAPMSSKALSEPLAHVTRNKTIDSAAAHAPDAGAPFVLAPAKSFLPLPEHHSPPTGHPDFIGSEKSRSDYPPTTVGIGRYRLALPASFGRQTPDDASKIAHDDPGRYGGLAYRYDLRGPDELREAGGRGFVSRKSGVEGNLNITDHQLGGARLNESRLVSFAKTYKAADEFGKTAAKRQDGWIYETSLEKHNTFDVASFYRPSLMSANVDKQQEVVATLGSFADVRSATRPSTGESIAWPFTPRSDLKML